MPKGTPTITERKYPQPNSSPLTLRSLYISPEENSCTAAFQMSDGAKTQLVFGIDVDSDRVAAHKNLGDVSTLREDLTLSRSLVRERLGPSAGRHLCLGGPLARAELTALGLAQVVDFRT